MEYLKFEAATDKAQERSVFPHSSQSGKKLKSKVYPKKDSINKFSEFIRMHQYDWEVLASNRWLDLKYIQIYTMQLSLKGFQNNCDPPYSVITLSAKMKPRIPATSWSRKITVRQTQNWGGGGGGGGGERSGYFLPLLLGEKNANNSKVLWARPSHRNLL